jgi:transcriptional regulator with XRE-family HTH domain
MSSLPQSTSTMRETTGEQLVSIGNALRERRLQSRLTQEQVARGAEISVGAVKNLENGKGSSVRSLLRVTRLYGIDSWVHTLSPPASPTVSPMQLLRQQQSLESRRTARRATRSPRP